MNKLDFVNPIQLPRWCSGKEPICQCKRCRRLGFHPWVPKILWKRAFPLFLPGKLRGQRSLVGYSPWDGRVRHDWVIEHTGTHACMHTHTHTHTHTHPYPSIWLSQKQGLWDLKICNFWVTHCGRHLHRDMCHVLEKTSHLKCGGTSELILPIEWRDGHPYDWVMLYKTPPSLA